MIFFFSETSPDFTSYTPTEERRPDTTIPDTTRQDKDIIVSSSGTTALQETTHPHTFGPISTAGFSPSSSSSSTGTTSGTSSSSSSSAGTSTTTTTRGTTIYIPPQTDTTIPYIIKETIPPEPSTPEHEQEGENEIYTGSHPEDYYDHGNHNPEQPMPEPETEPPMPPPFRTPPPFIPNAGIYNTNNNVPTTKQQPPRNKHGRINSEAEERTAMIIGIVAGALIAVILVILLVLWIKSNGDRSYKMEHDLKYGHGANAALLGHNAGHSNNQQHGASSLHGAAHGGHNNNNNNNNGQQHQQYGNGSYNQGGGQSYDAHGNNGPHSSSMGGVNGSLRQHGSQHSDRNGMSAGPVQQKAKRNSKDIKEWYV